MAEVVYTAEFEDWLRKLRDSQGKTRILTQIRRLQLGNPGKAEPVGEGVSELRIHFGPGYRVYFVRIAETYWILRGGDKDSQERDIQRAKEQASQLR